MKNPVYDIYIATRYIVWRNMNTKSTDKQVDSITPLSEQAFMILLSLAPGKKHGYAILKDVEESSDGAVVLSTSTLYGALGRMQEQGLIARVSIDEMENAGPGLPRKFYELTDRGGRILEAETKRMHGLVLLAQQRLGEAGE
jgi:PadR family transcriptional regulator PadR